MKKLNKNYRLIWMVFAIYFLFKQKNKKLFRLSDQRIEVGRVDQKLFYLFR